MGPEGNSFVNSPISTCQQGLTHSAMLNGSTCERALSFNHGDFMRHKNTLSMYLREEGREHGRFSQLLSQKSPLWRVSKNGSTISISSELSCRRWQAWVWTRGRRCWTPPTPPSTSSCSPSWRATLGTFMKQCKKNMIHVMNWISKIYINRDFHGL